jgi:hypothetical protein
MSEDGKSREVRKTGSPKGRRKSEVVSPKSEDSPTANRLAPPELLPIAIGTENRPQQTENMEVHHHPDLHHERKPWKEYILEYIMIFLAVTTGFFAESLRERIADSSKEKEYIVSMIEDARTDTANIHQCIKLNIARAAHLDTLSRLLSDYDAKPGADSAIYHYFRYGIVHPDFVTPAERTLTQLKSSGSMRLIRNKAAVDSIITYDGELKKLENQQGYYERYLNEANEFGMHILDFSKFGMVVKLVNGKLVRWKNKGYSDAKLINKDKAVLMEFGNKEMVYGGVVSFYITRLQETEKHAINLIHTLQQQYKLEDE